MRELYYRTRDHFLFLKSIGYSVLRIKENDYLKNNKETVERCIKFINENYERA